MTYVPPVIDYDAEDRWLVVTEWLGSDEYGASAIVARDVSPEWADTIRRLVAAAREPLDAAWREAEAALPEGWYFTGGSRGHDGYMFRALLAYAPTESELRRSPEITGTGPTPAVALLALAAALRKPVTA